MSFFFDARSSILLTSYASLWIFLCAILRVIHSFSQCSHQALVDHVATGQQCQGHMYVHKTDKAKNFFHSNITQGRFCQLLGYKPHAYNGRRYTNFQHSEATQLQLPYPGPSLSHVVESEFLLLCKFAFVTSLDESMYSVTSNRFSGNFWRLIQA